MTTQRMTVKWDQYTSGENTPGCGPKDVLAVKLITGAALPVKDMAKFSYSQQTNVMMQGCLSYTEGDFDSPIDKSPLGPTVTVTENFSLAGTNPPGSNMYPVVDPTRAVYFNLRCAGQDQDWAGKLDFHPPRAVDTPRR